MQEPTSAFAHPFRARLRQGRFLRLIWLALGSPALAEMAAQHGPDGVVLDLQHGLWERYGLEAAVGLAGAHAPVLVRSADFSHQAMATALDAGASAVMAPLVQSADDAQALVRAGRYPPMGDRSGGGVRPLRAGMAGMLSMGTEVALGAMIETARGVENADAICATPGLDFVFIGTGDLSLSLPETSPDRLHAACRLVLRAAQARGLPCGLFTSDVKAAAQARDEGYALAVVANDIGLAHAGFSLAMADTRP